MMSDLDELRCEWQRLYRSEPPRISGDLLIRGLGYRLQEIQHGGLGKSTRRKLKTLAKMFQTLIPSVSQRTRTWINSGIRWHRYAGPP
jgi:DUF2924 family protein